MMEVRAEEMKAVRAENEALKLRLKSFRKSVSMDAQEAEANMAHSDKLVQGGASAGTPVRLHGMCRAARRGPRVKAHLQHLLRRFTSSIPPGVVAIRPERPPYSVCGGLRGVFQSFRDG